MLRVLTLMLDDLFGYTDFFEYQLWERGGWLPVWQRRQPKSETPPDALLVSDTGYSVIVTAERLEFIALDPQGKELLRIAVGPSREGRPSWQPAEYPLKRGETAGWAVFFNHEGRLYFSWRFGRGARLVLRVGPDSARIDPDDRLSAACRAAEEASVLDYIARRGEELPGLLSPNWRDRLPGSAARRQDQRRRCRQALLLVLAHRLHPSLPLLRRLERCPHSGGKLGSFAPLALGPDVRICGGLRPLIQQCLRRLGQTPMDLPAYQFISAGQALEVNFPADRSQRLAAYAGEDALLTLQRLGSPDHLRAEEDRETWEYDCRGPDGSWLTTTLEWKRAAPLPNIARSAADWAAREYALAADQG